MKEDTLVYIAEALKYKVVVDMVVRKSNEISHRLYDASTFEYECYADIGRNLLSKPNHESIEGLARYHIRRKTAKYLKKLKYKPTDSLESMIVRDDDGNEKQHEITDYSKNIEKEILDLETQKEKVALLAQDDDRKKVILRLWFSGVSNTSEISRLLAQSFGGDKETHRKFVNRFKSQCKQRLADAV